MFDLPERIAVLGAFPIEVERFGGLVKSGGMLERAGPLKYLSGAFGSRILLVGTLGIGKVRAAAGSQAALDLFHPGLVLLCGTAGALAEGVRPLDLVVADRVLQHDTGPKEPEWLVLDAGLAARLEEASLQSLGSSPHKVFRGGLVTGDQPVLDLKARKSLAGRFGALAVDMEAAAAAAVAEANRVPLAVVKAITDSADRNGVQDFKKHVRQGAALAQEAVAALLGR